MTHIPRAQRFPIVAPVFWRPRSESNWSEGISVNASRSGVLFQTDQPLAVGTEVELVFAVSWERPYPLDSADVRCSGHITRTDERYHGAPAVALTIDYYSFLKQP